MSKSAKRRVHYRVSGVVGIILFAILCIGCLGLTRYRVEIARWFVLRDLQQMGAMTPIFHSNHSADLASVQFGTRVLSSGLDRYGQLISLDLSALTAPNEDLMLLAGTRVSQVILASTPLSDAGVQHLRGLRGVRFLDVSDTRLSGDALADIAAIESLTYVVLTGTQVEEHDVRQLQTQRPDLKIDYQVPGCVAGF